MEGPLKCPDESSHRGAIPKVDRVGHQDQVASPHSRPFCGFVIVIASGVANNSSLWDDTVGQVLRCSLFNHHLHQGPMLPVFVIGSLSGMK